MNKIRTYSGIALAMAAFAILLGPAALAQEKRPGDVKLAELLKKVDTQAMPDSYEGRHHQKWVDARMAKLTKAQKDLHDRLWAAKRRLNPNKNVGQSFVKILHYIARGEKLGRILTGDGYGQPQYSRHFVQLKGIKPGGKMRIHGRVTAAEGRYAFVGPGNLTNGWMTWNRAAARWRSRWNRPRVRTCKCSAPPRRP